MFSSFGSSHLYGCIIRNLRVCSDQNYFTSNHIQFVCAVIPKGAGTLRGVEFSVLYCVNISFFRYMVSFYSGSHGKQLVCVNGYIHFWNHSIYVANKCTAPWSHPEISSFLQPNNETNTAKSANCSALFCCEKGARQIFETNALLNQGQITAKNM